MSQEHQAPEPVTVIFPNGQLVSRVVDVIVRNRPIGWSKRSRSPYYNKRYAEWLQPVVDDMVATGRSKVFRKETFRDVTEQTLYLRINQALLYLVEQMDTPDKKYAKFKEETTTRKKQGVILEFRKLGDITGTAEDFVTEQEMPKWKQKMDEWLESENPAPFIMTNLLLSEQEQEQIKLEIDGLENIMASITTQEIKLVRVS